MQLGQVIGTLVATRRYQGLEGVKFLIVQPLDKQRRPKGEPVVAADGTAQAGRGEIVFFIGIREAALALPINFVPVDHAIVGIVDRVDVIERGGDAIPHAALQAAHLPSCPNPDCPDYGRTDRGNVIRYGRTRSGVQRYRCKSCETTFSD